MNLSVLVGDGEGSKLIPQMNKISGVFSEQMLILPSVNYKNSEP